MRKVGPTGGRDHSYSTAVAPGLTILLHGDPMFLKDVIIARSIFVYVLHLAVAFNVTA